MSENTKPKTHSIYSDEFESSELKLCTECPLKDTVSMSINPSIYNEHIFAIAHELRTPLAVMNSNVYNQLNMLRQVYHSIENTPENVDLIKKLKDSILIVEDQIMNIEDFIAKVSEYGLYNNSTSDDSHLLIHMKSYVDHIISIAPTFSRSMAIFGKEGIGYGDFFGLDFENLHSIVNPQDLNRIIINICTNAADAVSTKWRNEKYASNYFPSLRFRCLKGSDPSQTITMREDILGPFGCENKDCSLFLVIEDNGPGISKENLDHIFTYGFSTKKDNNNNHLGFGLHMCMQLARKNNLSLFIQTNRFGTKFFIGFPEIVVAKPGTLDDQIKVRNARLLQSDYNLLNFSEDSIELYRETVESTGFCSDAYKIITENAKSGDSLRVFDPKKKKKSY